MKHTEKGVLKNSTMSTYTPTTNALSHLLYMNYAGTFYCSSNYRITRKMNDIYDPYLFILVQNGTLCLDFQKTHFKAGAGDCLLFNSRMAHTYYALEQTFFHFVHFGGSQSGYYHDLICKNGHHLFSPKNTELIASIVVKLQLEAEQTIPNEFIMSAHLHMMLSQALCDQEDHITENGKKIAASIQYIKEHLHMPLSLNLLASQAHLSPYYFSRLFKQYTNAPPGEYILNLRLSQAKMLLLSSNLPVSEISERCGYQNSVYFISLFHKKTGITPLQFRKYHGNF